MREAVSVFVLAILFGLAGLISPKPAHACSCAQPDPASALAEYPAAFVGTLADVDGQIGGLFDSGADTIYRFEVETWVKGDLGHVVDIHAAASGASCGIEVGLGNRAGILVRVEGGEYHSSLCETVDGDVLIAAAKPLKVTSQGAPAFLIGGNIAGNRYLIVDSEGGVISAEPGNPFNEWDQPVSFSYCPGGSLLLETWTWQIRVRDLASGAVVNQIDLSKFADTHSIHDVRCMDDRGEQVWLASDIQREGEFVGVILDASDGMSQLFELPNGQIALLPEFALINGYESTDTTGQQPESVWHFSYEDGSLTTLARLESYDGLYAGFSGVSGSPDGERIAVLSSFYPTGARAYSQLTFFDKLGTEVSNREIDGEAWGAYWIDDDRFVVHVSTNGESTGSTQVHSAEDLGAILKLSDWGQVERALAIGPDIYGTRLGTLVRFDAESGVTEYLATYPTNYLGPMTAIPDGFQLVEANDGPAADPAPGGEQQVASPGSATTVPPVIVEATQTPEDANARGAAQIVAALAAIVGFGVFGAILINRKNQPRSESHGSVPGAVADKGQSS